MNLKTLDTVIAMVIVLLVLSLIVQSVQSLIKKWFKLKSRSILDSMHDLFKYVQDNGADAEKAAKAAAIVASVKQELTKLGRVSLVRKNPMVDSIAKDDLVKILDRIDVSKLQDANLTVEDLKAKVDKWYDTVMQGFEERYTRHMKTVAVCVSIVVVIFLNANFFRVYEDISTNDALRSQLIGKREEIEAELEKLKKAAAQPAEGQVTKEQLKAEQEQVDKRLNEALAVGFKPLKWEQVTKFFDGSANYDSEGGRFAHGLKVIIGWAIMVMLLSVGAPFWQDALESLFGIKNLLRKKSDTKNVEDTGGQPRT